METKKIGTGCGVIVLKQNTVLLGLRSDQLWTMPGGKMEFGESFEACVQREVLEETGIQISVDDLEMVSVSNDIYNDVHFVTMGFILKHNIVDEPQVMEPNKITEWKWFDIHNLPSMLFVPSKKVLENYIEGKLYVK